MKAIQAHRVMNLIILAFAFPLPAHVDGAGLRGLLLKHSSRLQPLQRPPTAVADARLAELKTDASPALAPMAALAPGMITMPSEMNIPKITKETCGRLEGKLEKLIRFGTGSGSSPASVLQERPEDTAFAPTPIGAGPDVECNIYAFESHKPVGCTCFIEAPQPPVSPGQAQDCPQVPDAIAMGFTGNVVKMGSFGSETHGFTRHTCVYRQWLFDPTVTGVTKAYQVKLADARTKKYIKGTYGAALRNAQKVARGFWALTPVPWFKLYPSTGRLHAGAPGPAAAAAGGAVMPTTPPIIGFGATG